MATACGSRLDEAALRAGTGGVGTGVGAGAGALDRTGNDAAGAGGEAQGSTGGTGSDGVSGTGGGGAAGGPGGGATKPEILLGSIGTQSGLIGAALVPIPVATRAWVADVNARGGLNGHPVRVIYGDDGGDPGRALSLARRMAEENRVIGFINGFAGTTQQAVTPYLEERRIPLVGGTGHPDADRSPMIFNPQTGALAGNYRWFVGTVATLTRAKKVALLYCGEASSCTEGVVYSREYAPVIGLEVVYDARISIAQPDYTAEMLSARNAGAEAVVMISDFATVIRAARSAHRQGWRPIFAGATTVYDQEFVRGGGDDVDGTLAYATVAPYDISPKMTPYLEAVRRHVPGGRVGDFGAEAWAGGKLMEAIAPFLGDRPGAERILAGLHSLRGETLGGIVPPLTFPRGAHGRVNLCAVPVKLQGRRFVAPGGESFFCALDDGIRRI